MGGQRGCGVSRHLRSMVCSEVRRASGAAMAVAPSGPRLLLLHREKSEGRGGEKVVRDLKSKSKSES
jgi:hypothetical protein